MFARHGKAPAARQPSDAFQFHRHRASAAFQSSLNEVGSMLYLRMTADALACSQQPHVNTKMYRTSLFNAIHRQLYCRHRRFHLVSKTMRGIISFILLSEICL